MTFEFRPAKRENVPLLLGVAGGTGSGKTMSALKLARGLAGTEPFCVIDTESGRAQAYADYFQPWHHGELAPPFSPAHYTEAIQAADAQGYGVIVVDSFSHEHAGDGGLLDMHDAELQRMAGDDWKKRETMKMAAWVKPKAEHKKMVSKLLQIRAHLVVCLRAEEKLEPVKENGKIVGWQPKRSLTGAHGWVPTCEKTLPYELTASFLLTADAPGVPKPIKLNEDHRPFVPLDKPLSEEVGVALAGWARGGAPLGEPETLAGSLASVGGADSGSPSGELATPDDRRGLFQAAEAAGMSEEWLRATIREVAGVSESKLIPRARVRAILDVIEAQAVKA